MSHSAEEIDRRRSNSRSRKSSNNKKRKVLEDAGLTESDRRQLRHQQRDLATEIDQSTTLDDLIDKRDVNNELFNAVAYTREAVLDAENMKGIVEKYSKHAESLVTVARYDAAKLIHKIRSQCSMKNEGGGSRMINWSLLGRETGICFNTVPDRVSFWSYPVETEKPVRKPRAQKQTADHAQEVKLKNVEEMETDADKLSATEKTMKEMKNTLRKRMKEENGKPIEALQYLLNPKSFTQTVENIFNFSFLIKRGQASIQVRKESNGADAPAGVFVAEAQACDTAEPKQAVISFTMQDWKDLCEVYKVEKGDLPHRTGSKQTRPQEIVTDVQDI